MATPKLPANRQALCSQITWAFVANDCNKQFNSTWESLPPSLFPIS